MEHWNDNVMTCISITTTGPTPGEDDLIQITLAPFNHKLIFEKYPFHANLLLANGGLPDRGKAKAAAIIAKGSDPYLVGMSLCQYIKNLVGENKYGKPYQIYPVCYDWANIRPWLVDLLGLETFNEFFHPYARDLLSTSLMFNDRAANKGGRPPYSKCTMSYLNSLSKSGIDVKYDTNQTCRAILAVYKKMLIEFIGI